MIFHRYNTPLIRATAGANIFDPEELVRPPEWTKGAACIGEDPETFFPKRGKPKMSGLISKAKAVCHDCPVANECLEYALALEAETTQGHQGFHSNMAGIWGGLTVHERQAILHDRHEKAAS